MNGFVQRFVFCGFGVVETRHALSLRHVGLYVSCLHLMEHHDQYQAQRTKPKPFK
jgi:hypothetical protein